MPRALPAEVVEHVVRQMPPCGTVFLCSEVHAPPIFGDLTSDPVFSPQLRQGRWCPICRKNDDDADLQPDAQASCLCCPACRFAPLLTCGDNTVEAATRNVHLAVLATSIFLDANHPDPPSPPVWSRLWAVPFACPAIDLVAARPQLSGVRVAQLAAVVYRECFGIDQVDFDHTASFAARVPVPLPLPDVVPLLAVLARQLTTLCVCDTGVFDAVETVAAAGPLFPCVTTLVVGVLSRWDGVDVLVSACPALGTLVLIDACHWNAHPVVPAPPSPLRPLDLPPAAPAPRRAPLPQHLALRRIVLDCPDAVERWSLRGARDAAHPSAPSTLPTPLVDPERHPRLVALHQARPGRNLTVSNLWRTMAFAASPAQFDLTVGTVQVSLAAGSAWRADTDASRAFQAALVDLENSGGPPSPTWSELQEEGDCFFRQHYQQDVRFFSGDDDFW